MPVKGDSSNTTKSTVAAGTIDIRENKAQNISALSRDTANSLNELGKIFDKAKIEEQQELAAVFGEEAFRLAHNMKDDGSGRKIAIHFAIGGIMSQITGAGFASGAVGAGLNEALINNLKGLDPGTAQIVSGIIGAAAAKVAGGNAMAGAAAAASGTKNNLNLEDLEGKVPYFREVHKRIEERKDDVAAQAMNEALYLVNSGSLVLEKMDADYMTIQLSVGEGIKVASTACTIDKYGNVYATIAFAPGASIGVPINTGLGWWPSLRNELKRKIENGEIEQSDLSAIARYYRNNVPRWGGSITAIGGIGGAIGLSTSGIISSEILASVSVGLSLTIGLTYYVGTIGGGNNMRTLIIATIKKTSQQVGKIISYTILVLFFCWLIAGIGYQLLGQKDIQERKAGMLNVLNGIDILDQLTLENIHLVQPAKALISYKLTAYFTTEKNKSTFIKQIRDYLLNNGWEIVLYENTPQSVFLEAKKDTYICTIETSSQESIHVWNVTIMCDDFFSRYNL